VLKIRKRRLRNRDGGDSVEKKKKETGTHEGRKVAPKQAMGPRLEERDTGKGSENRKDGRENWRGLAKVAGKKAQESCY